MPRSTRMCIEGATYHVFTRCIERRDLMRKDFYKEIMLDTLQLAQDKYSFDLVFYEVLDNHIHLVITTRKGEATISRIMQYVKARFAEKYNRKNGRTGPFWNERFGDVIVDLQGNPVFYFLWLLWYLAYNAVRKRAVHDPRAYKYGSINAYLDGSGDDRIKLTLHRFFLELGDDIAGRVKRFLGFEELYRKRLWMAF